jgi:GntR family transcriptional regulator
MRKSPCPVVVPAETFPLAFRCNTRHNTPVTHFQFTPQPGTPLHEQVAYAARKAIVSGKLRPGDPFPSVRALSRDLKIHANTAQKVIAQLQLEGLLEVHPGIGTVVAQPSPVTRSERARTLKPDVENLTVEALRLGLTLPELQNFIAESWRRLQPKEIVEK